jgi:hypothetical protein
VEEGEKKDLSEKEKAILDYITNNPGTTKQGVVEGLDGKYSRVTVFNTIKELDDYDMIIVRKDKPNSQIHKLFINDKDLFASLIQDLDAFEKAYFPLLKKAETKFKTSKEKETKKQPLLIHIFSLYEGLIQIYMVHALTIWPKKTADKEILTRLYTTLFSRSAKMQLKLLNSFPLVSEGVEYEYAVPISKNMAMRSLAFLRNLQSLIDYCKEYALVKEAEDVLDIIWKVSFDLFSFAYGNIFKTYMPERGGGPLEKEIKHWRELLELQKRYPELVDLMNIKDNSLIFEAVKKQKKGEKKTSTAGF